MVGSPEAEFKEFDPRLDVFKHETRFKYGWFSWKFLSFSKFEPTVNWNRLFEVSDTVQIL